MTLSNLGHSSVMIPLNNRVRDLVSVIIPAFNAATSLRRCIEKVLAQTYNPIEIILVNDGSTDETDTIAKSFGERLRYILQENQGETAARNRGFVEARGEFITFIDHDDYWEEQFVESTVHFLKTHPDTIAVSVGVEHRSALSDVPLIRPTFILQNSETDQFPLIIEDFFGFWAEHDHVCAGAVMLRGSLLNDAGGQRTDLVLSGDMEYWAYLATFGKWGFIPKILLHVDGTQVPRGNLYQKYYQRYLRCATVDDWEKRIKPRIREDETDGFFRIRGRVATWYIFAMVFCGRDRNGFKTALKYKDSLEGKFGRLWRTGLLAGFLTWKPLCILLRLRNRIQYWHRDWRRN